MSRKTLKTISVALLLLAVAVPAAAQGIPEKPHRVFGTVTDTGESVADANVTFRYSGAEVAQTTTDSSGYYDTYISYNSSYSGENLSVYVDGADTGTDLVFESGESEELNLSGDFISDLAVSVEDETVEEGSTAELSATVSDADSPSYTWSIDGEAYDATITGSGETVTFDTSDTSIDEDKTVTVEVEVSDSGNTASDTAEVTIEAETSQQEGDDVDTSEDTGTDTEEEEEDDTQEQPSEPPEPVSVEAGVKNGEAKADVQNVKSGQEVEVTIPESSGSDVESVSFTSQDDADSASVSVQKVDELPEDVPEISREKVYSYQRITLEGIPEGGLQQGLVKFKVNKSFVESKNASPSDVELRRFSDSWQELPTSQTGETDSSYRYEAELSDFSYFSIGLKEQDNRSQTGPEEQPDQGVPPYVFVVAFFLVVALLVALGAVYWENERVQELRRRLSEAYSSEDIEVKLERLQTEAEAKRDDGSLEYPEEIIEKIDEAEELLKSGKRAEASELLDDVEQKLLE